jgi:phytoene desaturase (3,4-didehydrolycopene-forming)
MDRTVPELSAHNIFLADDYRESFDDIFKHQLIPKQPSFYVNVPSRIDPTASPGGKDAIVVLVPVGHLLDDKEGKGLNPQSKQDWNVMVSKARTTVFETVEVRTGARGLREAVVKEIETRRKAGKILSISTKVPCLGSATLSSMSCLSGQAQSTQALIDCTSLVLPHPGTGVPICLAGSKVTSAQVLDDFKMQVPWRGRCPNQGNEVKSIDKVHQLPLLSNIHIALLMLVLVLISGMYEFDALAGLGEGVWR